MYRKILFILLFLLMIIPLHAQKHKTRNVVLITLDGFRWQELFNGADSSLMHQQSAFVDPIGIKNHFWKSNTQDRRNILLPFIWGTIGKQGQIYGNRNLGNNVNVTNTMWFSYPGYNEILTGHSDDARINSNEKLLNPNENVLEFINYQSGFRGRVAVFSSWDCFPYIINAERNGILVSSGLVGAYGDKRTENEKLLDHLMVSIPNPLENVRPDAFTFYYGLEYMKVNKPRVMYFAFDETDEFAHQAEYGAYLNSAHYTDRFIGELWSYLQSDPFYRGCTTLILSSDHGRGQTEKEWTSHGGNIRGADQIWIAILGPDTRGDGEIKSPGQHYQNQIAKTLAAFLNMDYTAGGKAGTVIREAFRH